MDAVKYFSIKHASALVFGLILKSLVDEGYYDTFQHERQKLKQEAANFYVQNTGSKNKPTSFTFGQANQFVFDQKQLSEAQKDQIISEVKKELIKHKNVTQIKEERFDLKQLLDKIQRCFVLNYQNKLELVSSSFKDLDINELGFVNQEQLVRLIKNLNLEKLASKSEFLKNMDPKSLDVITFNQFVQALKRFRVKSKDTSVNSIEWLNSVKAK